MEAAAYADELDWRVKAGKLREWRQQISIYFRINGKKTFTSTIDFLEIDKVGKETYTKVKGFATHEWRTKGKLFEVPCPNIRKRVVP